MMETLRSICKEANRRIETDPKVREMATAKDRTLVLQFTDEKTYTMELKGGKMLDPKEGDVQNPTLRVITDTQTLEKILNKKLNPLMAYATKKIKTVGPLDEVMLLKDFL